MWITEDIYSTLGRLRSWKECLDGDASSVTAKPFYLIIYLAANFKWLINEMASDNAIQQVVSSRAFPMFILLAKKRLPGMLEIWTPGVQTHPFWTTSRFYIRRWLDHIFRPETIEDDLDSLQFRWRNRCFLLFWLFWSTATVQGHVAENVGLWEIHIFKIWFHRSCWRVRLSFEF